MNRTLRQQGYRDLETQRARELVRRYLERMTGHSRAQITRLIKMYLEGEEVQPRP